MKAVRKAGRYGLILFSAGMLLGGAVVAEAAAQKAAKGKGKDNEEALKGAAIVFPAKGNLDPDQGTVEAVFSLAYSFGDQMVPEDRSAAWFFSLLSTHDSKGLRYIVRDVKPDPKAKKVRERYASDGLAFHMGLTQHRGTDVFVFGSSRFEKEVPYDESVHHIWLPVPADRQPWLKAGEWHTFAATWQREGSTYALVLYVDGKRVRAHPMPVSPTMGDEVFDAKDLLCIGYPNQMLGTLQSLRISKRARTGEEIATAEKAGLAKDADTLLLVNADTVSKMKIDRREDLINKEERTIRVPVEGMVFGTLEVVPGRDGKALRFQK